MRKLRITVGNKSYDVTVEDLTGVDAYPEQPKPEASASRHVSSAPAPSTPAPQPATPSGQTSTGAGPGAVISPMAGAIQSVLVKQGDTVKQGQPLVVLEAMKMENQITAPIAGTVQRIDVAEGSTVSEGQVLLVLE